MKIDAQNIADKVSTTLDSKHDWDADFKNDKYHFIIFRNKVFRVNRNNPEDYYEVKKNMELVWGFSYQLIFC